MSTDKITEHIKKRFDKEIDETFLHENFASLSHLTSSLFSATT